MSRQANPPELDADQVRVWIEGADAEVARLDTQVHGLQASLATARKRLMLLHELLASITKVPVSVSDEELRIGRTVRERTIEAAASILDDYQRPMTIQEIHAAFIRRGKALPGRGTPTNILAHLAASSLFVRRGRGVYALASWSPGDGESNAGDTGAQVGRRDDGRNHGPQTAAK